MHRMSISFGFFLGASLALGACASPDSYVLVTVDARAAVHDARSLTVSLSNGGTTRMDNLVMRDQAFPVTFSITSPGRTGDLAISVDAADENGLVVGHGTTTTTVTAPSASLELDPADFVVNTDFAGDQFPADDYESAGFQVAALPDGTWTTVFRDRCSSGMCNVFARRFDKAGKPVQTQAAAGTNTFTVTSKPTESLSTPAIASGQTTTVAVWDFYDTGTATTSGVACRTIDGTGRTSADQTAIGTDAADVVSVAPIASDTFVATWKTLLTNIDTIRMAILKSDCTPLTAVQSVSAPATTTDIVHRSSVAASAGRILFAWITNDDLHIRTSSSAGVLSAIDTLLVPQTTTDGIEFVRVAPATGGGFVAAVRWAQKNTSAGTGRIDLYRINSAGALVGTPTLVTDKSASDFANSQSFAMASRSDGTVLVAWHSCGALGDDNLCGVFGRILRDTGEAITDVFTIPTTTQGDQKLPSIAALPDAFVAVWSDASTKSPDIAGLAVRARIIYPPATPGTAAN